VASELAFRLPLAHTAAFPALFHDLDAATTADTGIFGYGVSVTTLEEVFLRIARSEEEEGRGPTGKPQGNGKRLGEAAAETSGSGQGPTEEGEAKERGQGGRPGPSLSKVRGECERPSSESVLWNNSKEVSLLLMSSLCFQQCLTCILAVQDLGRWTKEKGKRTG
jgi:hypothetical protein